MDEHLPTVVVAIITGVGTYLGTKTKSKYEVNRQQIESEANTEGIYVENMSLILAEYKEQVSGFREEVSKLRKENKDIKREFRQFKDHHYKQLEEYKDFVGVLETELEDVKIERDEWRERYTDLKGEMQND